MHINQSQDRRLRGPAIHPLTPGWPEQPVMRRMAQADGHKHTLLMYIKNWRGAPVPWLTCRPHVIALSTRYWICLASEPEIPPASVTTTTSILTPAHRWLGEDQVKPSTSLVVIWIKLYVISGKQIDTFTTSNRVEKSAGCCRNSWIIGLPIAVNSTIKSQSIMKLQS